MDEIKEEAEPFRELATVSAKPRLVLADSESAFRRMTAQILEGAGYEVTTASDGVEALEKIKAGAPDIAILDLQMASKSGLEVCRELRRNPLFASLPVIILTRDANHAHKLEGLALGVDDFLLKLGELDELLARIAMILQRHRLILDSNALSHLPGNRTIQTRVQETLRAGAPIAVLYLDLNNFKAYNDVYGYEAGDKVIRSTAELLAELVQEPGGEGDFLGHIGGDDFIYVTHPDRAEDLCKRVLGRFDALVPSFYKEEDLARGYVTSTDRQGGVQKFPLLGIAIGVAHNRLLKLESFGQIARTGAELKHFAKQKGKSAYVIDRRKN